MHTLATGRGGWVRLDNWKPGTSSDVIGTRTVRLKCAAEPCEFNITFTLKGNAGALRQ